MFIMQIRVRTGSNSSQEDSHARIRVSAWSTSAMSVRFTCVYS